MINNKYQKFNMQHVLSDLVKEIDRWKHLASNLQKDRDDNNVLRKKLDILELESKNLYEEIENLKEKIAVSEIHEANLTRHAAHYTHENSELRDEVKALKEKNKILENQNSSLNSWICRVTKDEEKSLEKMESKIEELKEDLSLVTYQRNSAIDFAAALLKQHEDEEDIEGYDCECCWAHSKNE